MINREALQGSLLVAETPPKGEVEQRERLRQSLELVQLFTRQAGHELPIYPITGVEDITGEPGVYILSGNQEENIKDTNFKISQSLLSGTRDSGHAVVSGEMTVELSGQPEPKLIKVAVKCFMKRSPDERLQRAKREIEVMQQLTNEGELTFKPSCIVVGRAQDAGNSCVAVMTEFDPSILSLDNHPWSAQTPENLSLAISATYALGKFNANGRFHGDAKIKNIAQDDMGTFGMIDFETSSDIDITDPSQASWCATADYHKLLDSLQDRGFFPNNLQSRAVIVDTLTEAYLDAWKYAPSNVQNAVLTACTDVQNAFHGMLSQKQQYKSA